MFFFPKSRASLTAPASLQRGPGPAAVAAHHALAPEERRQTDVPPIWRYPLEDDVLAALRGINADKCAFCDRADVPLRPYRFRPPAQAKPVTTPEDKDCYLWLAFDWGNLYPICDGCIPQDKGWFPVEGRRMGWPEASAGSDRPRDTEAEQATLYCPGEVKSPQLAFGITLDGRMLDRNKRARLTIEHFNLNRSELVRFRAEAMQDWTTTIRRNPGAPFERRIWAYLAEPFRDRYAGDCYFLFLHRIASKLAARFGPSQSLAPDRIGLTLGKWAAREGFADAVLDALQDMETADRDEARARDGFADALPRAAAPRPAAPLQRIKITNFKSLENIEITMPQPPALAAGLDPDALPSSPCLMILGENASGKSSVLEAVALAAMPAATRDELALDRRRQILDPAFMGGGGGQQFSGTEILLEFQDGGRTGLRITRTSDTTTPHTPDADLPPLFAYGAHRRFGPKRRSRRIRWVETLFRDDRAIPDPEPWLIGLAKRSPVDLDEVVSALRRVIHVDGEFRDIEVEHDDKAGTSHCVINLKKPHPGTAGGFYIVPQRLDVVSSGYRAVLALVCDIFAGLMETYPALSVQELRKQPAIVLVDEIEAHLHPRWKLRIVAGLRQALPGATFIFTSHDPLCIRGMRSGEVMMLHRYQNSPGAGQSLLPEVVEPVSGFENLEAMTVEQLLTSDIFQLMSTDDHAADQALALAADMLAGNALPGDAPQDAEAIARFNKAISDGLPYGRNMVTRVVQQAVAEYVVGWRKGGGEDRGKEASEAEKKLKAAIRDFLGGGDAPG